MANLDSLKILLPATIVSVVQELMRQREQEPILLSIRVCSAEMANQLTHTVTIGHRRPLLCHQYSVSAVPTKISGHKCMHGRVVIGVIQFVPREAAACVTTFVSFNCVACPLLFPWVNTRVEPSRFLYPYEARSKLIKP